MKLIVLKNGILLTLNSVSQHSYKCKNPHFLLSLHMVNVPYSSRDRRPRIGKYSVYEVAGGHSGYCTREDSRFWILMSGLVPMFRSVADSTETSKKQAPCFLVP